MFILNECVRMYVFSFFFFFWKTKWFSYFVSFKHGHLMSSAIIDDVSEPVCLSQDHRTCLPAKIRWTALTSKLKEVCGMKRNRETETYKLVPFFFFIKLLLRKCSRPHPLIDLKVSNPNDCGSDYLQCLVPVTVITVSGLCLVTLSFSNSARHTQHCHNVCSIIRFRGTLVQRCILIN